MKSIIYIFALLIWSSSCKENPINNDELGLQKIWNHQYVVAGVPSAAPLVLDSDLIIITGAKSLIALNRETGFVIWEGEIEGEGALQGRWLLENNQMIVSVHNNHLVAWDKNSGDLLINDGYSLYDLGGNNTLKEKLLMVGDTLDAYIINPDGSLKYSFDVPFASFGINGFENKLFLSQGKTIHGALTKGKIRAFEASNGDSLWTFETNEGGFVWSAPIVENGVVYAGTYLGNPSRVFAIDAETGETIWERPGFSTYQMITNEQRIYVNTQGSLQAIEKSNGEIAWSVTFESSGTANIVYMDGYVYHVRNSELVIVQDSTGKVVHREPVPDGTFFWHVAASSDKIFVQTSRQLIAYQPWHLRD
ncbi:MAG: PQQ-binding-like beta-propeller repeat protein [Balneola sp.]